MHTLSYYIETNNDEIRLEYREIQYTPASVIWQNGVNAFRYLNQVDPEEVGSPEYVRIGLNEYAYYKKYLIVPVRETTFSIHVLVDGSEDNTSFNYDVFSDFMTCTTCGSEIIVSTKTNNDLLPKNSSFTIKHNTGNADNLYISVYQDYTHVQLAFESYTAESFGEVATGTIQGLTFEHTFKWLTEKTSPSSEKLTLELLVIGPRNRFFVKSIEKYDSLGELDDTYVYSNGGYFRVKQKYTDGEMVTYHDPVIVGDNGLVYDDVRYENDLDIVVSGNNLVVTNYGRCFLSEDAFYVITLANSDDVTNVCTLTIRYENEGD